MQAQNGYSQARKLLVWGLIALSIALISAIAEIPLSIQANQLTHVSSAGLVDPQPDAPVTCNDKPMKTDEICQLSITYNGTTSKIDKTYDMQKKIQSDGRINAIVEQKNKAIDQQEGILNAIGVPLSVILLVSFITAIILLVKYFNAHRRVRVSTSANL
ncbi:hypothetical protein [Ktedonobacter robiniae]|uniref:Uncharacterized protein n=1 Tax=Ktedonobacter robiniae TaxID=2778365 RepID=A0ABQ3UWV8_9CHLR|nr:hypothetical protein [Ktedonobacter robiniae]GHO57253.1 hypothetical protein KSB_57280 [Ktedonobacter robiniae]